jgi:hypothetical protein
LSEEAENRVKSKQLKNLFMKKLKSLANPLFAPMSGDLMNKINGGYMAQDTNDLGGSMKQTIDDPPCSDYNVTMTQDGKVISNCTYYDCCEPVFE